MKKIILTLMLFGFIININAQNFGVKAGVDFATAKADYYGISESESETGFYIGAFTQLKVLENLKIRTEVNYIHVEDLDQIQLPLMVELEIVDKFNLLAGPSFGFILDPEVDGKAFNFGLDFGLSYNVTENFLIEAQYNLGLSNLIDDKFYDGTVKLHGLLVGIGYNMLDS
ncbi:porin family protein [Aestuariivivens sediminis]|uniref:porin family protein n=1 Tax=Aestuariivivens sediminis TaxID=2913557 RepID=UPI001F57DF47|nr:porin family protein [Aestuariivivens sediminis]